MALTGRGGRTGLAAIAAVVGVVAALGCAGGEWRSEAQATMKRADCAPWQKAELARTRSGLVQGPTDAAALDACRGHIASSMKMWPACYVGVASPCVITASAWHATLAPWH